MQGKCGKALCGGLADLKVNKTAAFTTGQMVVPGAVYLNYYGILRGLRPVQPANIRTTSHAGFPAWLVVF
jgi:hypothetical protein